MQPGNQFVDKKLKEAQPVEVTWGASEADPGALEAAVAATVCPDF